ncbi:MAG: hypothetical protein ACI8SR_001099 [Oceanicoccus sp.]|jgi:hypothetical protein
MVAQCTTHNRCKTVIYLALIFLCACTDNKYTVVELHHRQPSDLIPILDKQLAGEVEYAIAGQTIIFYTSATKLQPTIALLNSLDRPSPIYTLSFSWESKYKRSTTKLPPPITIQSDTPNTIKLFNDVWQISIKPVAENTALITLEQKNDANIPSNRQLLVNGPQGIAVQLIQPQEKHEALKQQFLIILNEKERISHSQFPEDLAITVTSLK